MTDYIVSARKYRPSSFKSVVGQKALVQTLKNAISGGKLAHAYLFCGPRGVGKTTCARIFAKTINCFNPTAEGEACNACESCVSFNEQRSFNIHELDAASNNGVEHIRDLTAQVQVPPQVGKYKLYIIDEVHMLSQAAFNAFLKTLEEPPLHAIFILATTEKHKIIPTILSRCQIYDFTRISVNDTVEHLKYVASSEGVEVEIEALNVIAQKADGGMRDALSIFDQVVSFCGEKVTYQAVIDNLNVLDYDYYFRLVDILNRAQVPQALLLLDEIINKGFDIQSFVSGLASHLRDVLVSKDELTISLLEVADVVKEKYRRQAAETSIPFLYRALELLTECELNYKQSKNKKLLVELSLIRLAQLNNSAPPESSGGQKKNIVLDPLFESQSVGSTVGAAASQSSVPSPQSPESVNQSNAVATSTPVVSSGGSTDQGVAEFTQSNSTSPAPRPTIGITPRVSILRRNKKEETPVGEEQTIEQDILDAPYTEEALIQAWLGFSKLIPEEVMLRVTIESSLPKGLNNDSFTIEVDTPTQQSIVNLHKQAILAHLSKELHNNRLNFEVELTDPDAAPRFKTSQQRFADMLQRRPDLQQFKQQFGLELV
ncbi:MAG: DNA polymerase III subunit gamma/tau [Bacteroidales bacterium]